MFIHQHIDLLTAKKEDLTFDAPFSLTATRNDCTHFYHPESNNELISFNRRSRIPRLV